jgi:hypothetical protein
MLELYNNPYMYFKSFGLSILETVEKETRQKFSILISDAPHVLKRARNHCAFHKGFLVPSGFCADVKYKLGPQDFSNILHENGWARENGVIGKLGPDDTRTGFRFTPEHLKSTGNKAQNVRKAVQTFSHTNAKTLLVLGRKNVYSARHAQALHDSVKLFNDWYDSFKFFFIITR